MPAAALRPGHFFVLATVALMTLVLVLMRGMHAPALVLLALTVAAGGYAAFTLYRLLVPLVDTEAGEEAVMIGGRTRAALERDKLLTLRAIKELEFDHAMGKVAEADFAEMRDRLRARAMRLIRQLDGAAGYRTRIEQDVAARRSASDVAREAQFASAVPRRASTACPGCGAANDADARFCKACGSALVTASASSVCVECGAPTDPDARFCKMCGHAVHATA